MINISGAIRLLLLIIAVSADGFCSAFGLGASGITIPPRSAAVISASGAAFLAVSAAFGGAAVRFIPNGVCGVISSTILTLLGVFNLFHKAFEKLGEKLPEKSKLRVYLSDEAADCDKSKDISCKEALVLSAALSADSLAAGLGAGFGSIPIIPTAVLSFLVGFCFVTAANALGEKAACGKTPRKLDFRCLCGGLLIAIAFFKA